MNYKYLECDHSHDEVRVAVMPEIEQIHNPLIGWIVKKLKDNATKLLEER